jgi:hypothetical protein
MSKVREAGGAVERVDRAARRTSSVGARERRLTTFVPTPGGVDIGTQLLLQGEEAGAGLLLSGMVGAADQWPRFHMPEAEA